MQRDFYLEDMYCRTGKKWSLYSDVDNDMSLLIQK